MKHFFWPLACSSMLTALAHPPTRSVDVAVVGGGLSGLTAAKKLLDAGKSVLVLEARDRVGGKILNVKLSNGGVTEVGAEFVGPTQDKVLQYISNLGLETFDTYNNGSGVFWQSGKRVTYAADPATGGFPPLPAEALEAIATTTGILDGWAAEIDINAPWNHPNASAWDRVSLAQWAGSVSSQADTKFFFDTFSESVFATEADKLSLLYVISYIAAAGNETTKGTTARLLSTPGGAQEKRVVGGTQLIPLTLAERIGKQNILFNTVVRCIVQKHDEVEIQTNGVTIHAKEVVMALGPTLVNDIDFSPQLPKARKELNERMRMGNIGKAIAVYDSPFWRTDEDLNGRAISDEGATKVTFDNTPESQTFGAIMGFILGEDMRALDKASPSMIRTKALSDYNRYFGSKAAKAKEVVIQRWDLERFSKGGPVAHAPPGGVLSTYGSALRQPFGSVHWAGTETADYWIGYMDGAIRSGERVAREILGY